MNKAEHARLVASLALVRLIQLLFLFRLYPCLSASVRPVS